jgi:predicted ribonuclease YlaK
MFDLRMENQKQYVIDTKVLLEDPHSLFKLRNGNENWIVKKFRGSSIYAHIVLKGEKSRGPITDLVINSGP